MGGIGAIVGLFLMFSLAVSWVSGDKEKARLEDKVKETKSAEMSLEHDLNTAKNEHTKTLESLRDTEKKLKDEISEKKKLERALAFEERQRRLAEKEGVDFDLDTVGSDHPAHDGADIVFIALLVRSLVGEHLFSHFAGVVIGFDFSQHVAFGVNDCHAVRPQPLDRARNQVDDAADLFFIESRSPFCFDVNGGGWFLFIFNKQGLFRNHNMNTG